MFFFEDTNLSDDSFPDVLSAPFKNIPKLNLIRNGDCKYAEEVYFDIEDVADDCSFGNTDWTSSSSTDHDTDGCEDDSNEDLDDDNDGIADGDDDCATGDLGWTSTPSDGELLGTDHDQDGCQDSLEDGDDDNDFNGDEYDASDPD